MSGGQGSPATSHVDQASVAAQRTVSARMSAAARVRCGVGLCAVAICSLLWATPLSAAEDPSLRIRVEWGGGAERVWEGSIALSHGTLAEPRSLGVEADEPGSMWIHEQTLLVRSRSPRTYDGVDLLVRAAPGEQLIVQLSPAGEQPAPPVRIPLSDMLAEFRNEPLDSGGNRLLVRRCPGDKLRVTLKDKSLVYLPGDSLRLEVEPHLLPLEPDSKVRLTFQLVDGRGGGNGHWQSEHTMLAGDAVPVPVTVPLPNQEGVYDVIITATPSGWQQAVRNPLGAKPVAERRVQVVVINPRAPASAAAPAELVRVGDEIDPTVPRRNEERLVRLPALSAFTHSHRPPLGNASVQSRPHPLGAMAQLNPSRHPGELTWEAYTLSIQHPGLPHVLEVDYPSDVPQSLGISVVEPSASGAAMVSLDSGVEVPEPLAAGDTAPRWLRHRLIFWPHTKSPVVLVTNRSDNRAAVYGKLRVLGGWQRLPPAFSPQSPASQRLWAAYLDRPLIPENFSANEVVDAWIGRGLDDWVTFYEGGTRLVDYLRHVGYDGLMLSVLADGSTIYPSAALEPTPRYDTGVYLDSAQDPVRKDVLEMLLRLFDREKLRMIPALEFASPLPKLEQLRQQPNGQFEGIDCIGARGLCWTRMFGVRRGLAAYYNVLDPRVQEAMLAVVREVVAGYAQHPSFAGLALQLSGDGYAQLPGVDWALDDVTVGRFQHDMHVQVPGEGPQRFAERARFLAEPGRRIWLQWRADQMQQFYQRVYTELNAVRPGCRLYLAGGQMFTSGPIQDELRPTLPRKTTLAEALLLAGIDVRHYLDDHGIVLLRSEQICPLTDLASQATNLEWQQLPDADRVFHDTALAGSLFFHPPQRNGLPSFDEKGPFHPGTLEQLVQTVPAARQNRRRFLRSLAVQDPTALFDGGWMLPLGEEESLRDLLRAYRRLPAARFEKLAETDGADPSQPVTVRYHCDGQRTWVYLVNDAPFAVSATLRLEAPPDCRIEELSGLRPVAGLRSDEQGTFLPVELDACDLLAICCDSPAVRLLHLTARPTVAIDAELAGRIRNMVNRSALLASPPPLPVLRNAGFETRESPDGRMPGWILPRQQGVIAQTDTAEKHEGNRSLHFHSAGPPTFVVSEPFAPPPTGRLSVSVWMRVADAGEQPPLQLAIQGKLGGRDYYRYAPIGRPLAGAAPLPTISSAWANYIFQVDDLPLEGLTQTQVRFDLLGPGEVWIDDVQVHHLYFSKKERGELSKLIALAEVKLQQGQLNDCLRLLEGYWPRFLETQVVVPAVASDNSTQIADEKGAEHDAAAKSPAHPDRSSLLERLRSGVPLWRF